MFIKYLPRFVALFYLLFTIGLVQAGTTGKLAGRVTIKGTGEPMIGANAVSYTHLRAHET